MDDEAQTIVILRTTDLVEAPAPEPPRGGALEPGAEVGGRYRIERLLGRGGMGRVWLADDIEQRRQVAFKEMIVPDTDGPAELEAGALLFRREYFAMKKLQHPGTVKVYDCGLLVTGNRYITMEVVSGEDLSEVAKRRPLSTREIYRFLIELSQILAFVHSRLFVHCDIKADNVRITDAGTLKLMDFGIMHPLGTRPPARVLGTPAYTAPERQRGGIVDGRADLYSLGVLGFFLLTRRVPFVEDNVHAMLYAHMHRPPPKPSALVDVDPALEAVVLRLLEKDPKDRYASAAELVAALSSASGEPVAEEPLAARASYLHIPVVVGRERETAELAARLSMASRRSSRGLLLGAPAGVGKSRLLQEFELDAKNADVPFALGQCRAEGLSARAPIEQALRALVPSTPPAVLEPLRPILGTLLPALAVPDPPVFRDASEEKMAVFDALARWLRALSDATPFVLCLEDLHWADSATLEHMNVIVRALHGTGGLLIAAFRSDELSRLSLAFQTVDEGLADYVELSPLSKEDLGTLTALALQGFQVGGSFIENLYDVTKGNVFFATECLRALIEEGALRRILGKWSAAEDLAGRPLPRSIEEAVLARLSTLSDEHVAFFRRLAPVGRVLDMPLIQAIAGVPRQDLFQVLDEGIERQFLQYSEGRYFFTHDKVREAIYASTPEPVRKGYHGNVAEYLAGAARGDSSAHGGAARAIGYHFARSLEPTRAIGPLLRAGQRALDNKALLEAFQLLEEAANLLEAHPYVPDRDARLIATWGKLVEVGYHSSTPACIHYAGKLFNHWDATVDLGGGAAAVREKLAYAAAAPDAERPRLMSALFREVALDAAQDPEEIFLKRSEYRILESIALAIMGRTAEFTAGLKRTAEEHPPASPYRAAALIAMGGLTAHTGRFRGVVDELRGHLEILRRFRGEVAGCPRRLGWALGMGAYLMNMNLGLMGLPLDERATQDGFEVAEQLGFTDLRVYHLFSQIVRASFAGDGAAFMPAFAEMNDLMRKLGNPRLPERNLAIYTPPYYLERGELELARAVVERAARLVKLLPGDRWLKLYVEVYRACLCVAAGEMETAEEAIESALSASRASDFRVETLVLVYQSRFELARGDIAASRSAAVAALARATDPIRENPFDEILARRALADLAPGAKGVSELKRAMVLAERTGIVLQEGIVRFSLAGRTWDTHRDQAMTHLAAAEERFASARAERWLKRARSLRGGPPDGRSPS